MNRIECTREHELIEALQSSRWPEACDASLNAHVEECPACRELLTVAAPLLDEHRALMQEAAVPSSAIVWWRAQMRSRREAVEQAAQPVSFVQGIVIACAAGLLATALSIFVPTFRKSLSWMVQEAGSWSGVPLPALSDALASPMVLAGIAAIGLCALALPVALYFAFAED